MFSIIFHHGKIKVAKKELEKLEFEKRLAKLETGEEDMTKKNRIEYLICTLCIFVTGFLLYGSLGIIQPMFNENQLHSFLLLGCLGGFGFSMMVSTIILSVGFFKKRGLKFKIVAAILWPLTFAACSYAGALSYIPYQIYNVVKLVTMIKEEKKLDKLDFEKICMNT